MVQVISLTDKVKISSTKVPRIGSLSVQDTVVDNLKEEKKALEDRIKVLEALLKERPVDKETTVVEVTKPTPTYFFDIEKDNHGRIVSVVARPQGDT